MYKLTYITVSLILVLFSTACTDALNPNNATSADLEIMAPMTSSLLTLENEEASGNGIFILNWNMLNPRFSSDNENSLGMAMALGFKDERSFEPPYYTNTVDMGLVIIESAQEEAVELSMQTSRFSGKKRVYSYRSFGPFSRQESLTYKTGSEYTIRTSGSDVFPALNIKAAAPDKQVSIMTPFENRLENHTGAIELSWEAVSDNPVAIHIRPSFNPKAGEKPGKFNREDSEMILLEDQNGSYTIPGENLSEIADRTGANVLHISVGQIHVSDVEYGGQIYRVIMRTADHRIVELN